MDSHWGDLFARSFVAGTQRALLTDLLPGLLIREMRFYTKSDNRSTDL